MKRISIRQAMIEAIEQTDEGLGRYPNQMLNWAKYIEKAIGSKNGYKVKSAASFVTGSSITLPDDCYSVLGIIPGNWEDETNIQYRNISNPMIQEDILSGADVYGRDLSKLWIPENTTWINETYWEIVGNEIQLINQYTNQELTLVYQYNETDDKGYWIVNESHIPAIAKYIVYMYSKKYLWKSLKGEKMLRQGTVMTVKDYKNEYNRAIRNARAEDGQETPFEKAQY